MGDTSLPGSYMRHSLEKFCFTFSQQSLAAWHSPYPLAPLYKYFRCTFNLNNNIFPNHKGRRKKTWIFYGHADHKGRDQLNSIAVSVFVNIGRVGQIKYQNKRSQAMTILILKRGPCLNFTHLHRLREKSICLSGCSQRSV